MPSGPRPTPPSFHADGPTTLFHSTTRPRPLLMPGRRSRRGFEMVIDLRDEEPTAGERPLLVLEWGADPEPTMVIDLR